MQGTNVLVGTTLDGRYYIVEKLGRGAFGQTYKAQDRRLPGNPYCVVKQLQPHANHSSSRRQAKLWFEREAKVLQKLGSHKQIPQLMAYFEENGEFYLVEELIEGHDLSAEITDGKRLSESYVKDLLRKVLSALEFIHQNKVIHRDLKPSNLIRRASDGQIFIIDFGIVKETNSQGQISSTHWVGTFGYIPVEQALGKPKFSSDIYALGMTAIQALTGVLPIQLPTDPDSEIIWRNLVNVSDELAGIIDKMVRHHLRDRYQSASEVLADLEGSHTQPIIPQSIVRKFNIIYPAIALGTISLLAVGVLALLKLKPDEIFINYENQTNGIRIEYPQTWALQDGENKFSPEVATFLSPKESDQDKYQEQVIASIDNLKKPISLAAYTKSSIQEIKRLRQEAEILTSEETTLAKGNADRVVYTFKDKGLNFKAMEVWTLKNNQAYRLIYIAEARRYSKFESTAAAMIKSFDID